MIVFFNYKRIHMLTCAFMLCFYYITYIKKTTLLSHLSIWTIGPQEPAVAER